MSALLQLAERCEQATGPDRELDRDIASAVHLKQLTYSSPEWIKDPEFTASIDSAMKLVPEGWRVAALCEREPWFCRLETLDFDSVTWGKGSDWLTEVTAGQETTATAAAPALALCAAALRAQNEQVTK